MILQKNPVHFKEIPLFMCLLFPLLSHGGSVHVNENREVIFVFIVFFFPATCGCFAASGPRLLQRFNF